MKRIIKLSRVFLLGVFVLTLLSHTPPKDFTGTIVYNISYDESEMDPQMLAYLPKTMKMTIKAPMSRTEINMGMGNNITIFDSESMTGTNLIDMMGQKLAVKIKAQDIEKEFEKTGEVDVEITDETKNILGYTCKKAIVKTSTGDLQEITVYFTSELSTGMENKNNPLFKDIEGMMLEFSMSQNGMNMHFTAVKVEKERVSDKIFRIPEGYEELTQEELQKRFGM